MTSEQKKILTLLLVPAFASLLAVSSINVVLPSLRVDLNVSTTGIQWIVSGYALVFGILLVTAGRAGDVFGRGRLFVAGLTLFGLGSLGSGLAPDIVWINLARLVMGVGSGLLNPQVSGMIQQYFTGNIRGRAFGIFGGAIGVSVAVGPIMSGAFVTLFGNSWGWRASFLVNVPIALGAAWAAHKVFPASAWHGSDSQEGANARLIDPDLVGMILLAVTTLFIMAPFVTTMDSWLRWLPLPVAAVTLVLWTAWEASYKRRGRQPMVDLGLFTHRSFANGCLIIALYFLGSTSVWLVIAQYLQDGLGQSAMVSGAIGIPAALASAVAAPLAGRHVLRLGRVMVLAGLLIVVLGLVATMLVAHLNAIMGVSHWWMMATLCVLGAGQGLVVSPNQTLTLAEVPLRYAGAAGGVLQTGQRIGTSIGVAAISSIAFSVSASSGWALAFQLSLGAIIVSILAAGTVALVDMNAARRADARLS